MTTPSVVHAIAAKPTSTTRLLSEEERLVRNMATSRCQAGLAPWVRDAHREERVSGIAAFAN